MSTDPTRAAVHELRNLLTAILGFADLMERRRPDDEWVVKTAGRIRDAAQRAREATERIGTASPAHDEALEAHLGGPRVLVVEEDPLLRAQVRDDLERSRFEVHDVPDSRTAIAMLRAGAPHYDVIVLDWQAAAPSARDVVDALHEGHGCPALIVISDTDMPSDLSERRPPDALPESPARRSPGHSLGTEAARADAAHPSWTTQRMPVRAWIRKPLRGDELVAAVRSVFPR